MSLSHQHPNSNALPQAVIDANAALAAEVSSIFREPENVRQLRIAALQGQYGSALGDPVTILRMRKSAKVMEMDYKTKALEPFITEASLAPAFDHAGNLINPLAEAARNSVSWEMPTLPEESRIQRWTPDTNTFYDLSRCFAGCPTEYSGLAISSRGGAYGVQMEWSKQGICLPAFANPQQFQNWFDADAMLTGLLWNIQAQKLRQRVVMNAITHRFTLNTDGTSYLLNNNPLAPAPYGDYRYRNELHPGVRDPAKLGPLALPFLNAMAHYYRTGVAGIMGSYEQTLQGTPSWAILDGQPGGWLEFNVYNNPEYQTRAAQFAATGTVRMDYSTQPRQSNILSPWHFVESGLFPGYGVSPTGALIPLKLTAPSASIDPTWAKANGLIVGDVDIVDPASRTPYAVMHVIAPTKMATILTVTEPYAHSAFGEQAYRMMHSGAGLTVPRPRQLNQIADIYDTHWRFKAIVIPNKEVENASVGILARAQVHTVVPLSMCNLSNVINVVPDTTVDVCARNPTFAGFLSDEITGAADNPNAFPVAEVRLLPGSTVTYAVQVALQPGQTYNVFDPFQTGVNGTVTVRYTDRNGVNSERVAATLTRGLQYFPTQGGMELRPQFEITFASALPAGSVIREVSVPDVSPTGVNVVPGSIREVRDASTDALVAGQLDVEVAELPTPALWAQGATKTLTAYAADGSVLLTIANVTLVDTDNQFGFGGTLLRLSAASGSFTLAALTAANITRITLA